MSEPASAIEQPAQEAVAPAPKSGMGSFLVAWSGQVVSTLGSGLTSFALGVWLFQRSGSATQWTLLVFCYTFATVLALPFAGALVDRWDRRNALIVSNLGAALGSGALAALAWSGHLHPWQAYAAAMVTASFNAFQLPAFNATVPLLVSREQLGRTAGLVQLGMAVPSIVGPLLAGALVVAVGLGGILVLDLASFGIALLTLLVVRFPRAAQSPESAASRGSLGKEIAFGWKYLRARPGLLALLYTFAGVNFCLGMVQAVLPPMVLGFASPAALGTTLTIAGLGMAAGGIVMSVWGGPKRRVRGIFLFLCLLAAILFLAGFKPSVPLVAAAGFLFMFCFPIVNGCAAAIWQRKIAPDVLGRTYSLQRVIAIAGQPLAALLAGPLAEYVFGPLLLPGGALAGSLGRVIGVGPGRGIALLFITLGIFTYVALVWGWSNPRLRNLEEEVPDAMPSSTSSAAAAPARGPRRPRRWVKRVALAGGALLGLLLLATPLAYVWMRNRLQASLPKLAGEQRVSGVSAPVAIARDARGVPDIQGASRRDVAFATGFVHAQDRLFQMDVLRRLSAGELSALLGPVGLSNDRSVRVHRFRARAKSLLASSPAGIRELLQAYAAGVNAGRASLGEKPFEYLALRTEPEPWRPEDSFLVLLSMFARLQDRGTLEAAVSQMHDAMPAELFQFLNPQGTEWDAPLVGGPLQAPPVPGPAVCDLRQAPKTAELAPPRAAENPLPGSAAWAVAGSRTADGGALLANELHMDLAVPNYWYRVSLSWPDGAGEHHRVTGVTLPGTPAVVLGSNGKVAWGITNSAIDTSDLVLLDVDPSRPDFYATPQGPRRFARHRETIQVKGGAEEEVDADWTVWGPVVGSDGKGRLRALRWVAHEPDGVNFEVFGLETAQTVEQALAVAHRSGVPAVNFIAADAGGHIAWSVMGRIPRRAPGFDGQVAGSWRDTAQRWQGLLPPDDVPQIVDPDSGRVWNANNRSVDGEMLARLGGGAWVFGARARQIRDDLFAVDRATVEDMRRIQLDDRALFVTRWHDLLLSVLTPDAVAADPRRRELRELVEHWGGRAAVGSAGYRMVKAYRLVLGQAVFRSLFSGCSRLPADFDFFPDFTESEGALWRIVTERPPHLLDPRYQSWREELLASVDQMFSVLPPGPLRDRTWGERNTTLIQHPLSRAVPVLGRWLDMPQMQLPGDIDLPRAQLPSWGATLRMVVSPGREAAGYFHMPGGQSGHPLSAHYRDGHADWAAGRPTPFLPGPPVHTLRLLP
jgi:penicillin G amidase